MRLPRNHLVLVAVAVAATVASCIDGTAPTDLDLARPAFVLLDASLPPEAADELVQVNRIRLTARESGTGAILSTTVLDVDPDLSEWVVGLELEVRGLTPVQLVVDIELIHVVAGVEEVQWSGRTGVLSARAGEEIRAGDTPLFRGGLDNLTVTAIRIERPVPALIEGDTLRLTAQVSGGSGSTKAFWRSLDAQVATVNAAGLVSTLLPGSARIVAEAGPRADTVLVPVGQRVAGVVIDPDSVLFESLAATTGLIARVVDPRGEAIPDRGVNWSVGDPTVVEHLGDGTFRSLRNGQSWVVAAMEGDPSVRDSAWVVVRQRVASVVVSPDSAVIESLGAEASFTVRVLDPGGNEVTGASVGWASRDPGLAEDMGGGAVRGIANGRTWLVASEAGGATDSALVVVSQQPASIHLEPGSILLESVGAAGAFTARVLDAGGTEMAGRTVTWSSADPAVAASTGGGAFVAVGAGQTWAVAADAANPAVRDSAQIVVRQRVVTLTIEPESVLLEALGAEASFSLRLLDAAGAEIPDAPISWSARDPGVAESLGMGRFRAVSAGSTWVTAASDTDPSVVDSALVVVRQSVVGVDIDPGSVELTALGQEETLVATFLDAGGHPVPGVVPSWSSSVPSVATVSGAGIVRAQANGETEVTVSGGGHSASARVVVAQAVAAVALTPASTTLNVGATISLSVSATDANGHPVHDVFTQWSSLDPSVATVNSSGIVTAVAPGTATIRAFVDGLGAVSTITVVAFGSSGRVYVSNTGDDAITFIDLGSNSSTVHDCYDLAVSCNEPRNLAVNTAGTLVAVPFRHSDRIVLFDPAVPGFVDDVVHASFDEPYAVAFTADGSELWVANKKGGGSSVGSISIVDVASRTVLATMSDADFSSPEGITIVAGKAFVANRGNGTVTVVDVATRTVLYSASVGAAPRDVAGTPDGQWVYVTTDANYLKKVRVSDGMVTQITLPSGDTRNITVSPDGSKIFTATMDNCITVVDVATDAVRQIVFAGASETYGVAILKDGSLGFVTDVSTDKVYLFDPDTELELIQGLFPLPVAYEPRGIVAH